MEYWVFLQPGKNITIHEISKSWIQKISIGSLEGKMRFPFLSLTHLPPAEYNSSP